MACLQRWSFLEYFPLFLPAGPVSSILVNRFGCRTVVMVGGLMSGVSVAAASLANSIVYLYLFIGIIGGTGSDLKAGGWQGDLERGAEFLGVLSPDRRV